jgi:DNA-binding response OmpR family regulator
MVENIRVLFVDDEPTLRVIWPAILTGEGFQVSVASTVPEALRLITSEKYDVLIADLNIGQPGDGFTVTSAMRRVQPNVLTIIWTGYPAFQAALRAIHDQVDDFVIKGTDASQVVKAIRENLARDRKRKIIFTERLPQFIARNKEDIVEAWYQAVEKDPEIKQIKLRRIERIDHLPQVLDELIEPRDQDPNGLQASRASAVKHGATRRTQGYSLSMLLEETRLLHHVIAQCTQQHLQNIDISNLIPDLIEMDDRLHRLLKHSLETFLQPGGLPDAA